MKKQLLALIFYACVCIAGLKLFQTDKYDRTHPYGLDITRNKRLPSKVGENYGVTVYWGKPNRKDTTKQHLDKIEWLNTSFERDVEWRRSMFLALILAAVLLFVIEPTYLLNIQSYMIVFLVLFMFLYFHLQWTTHHLTHRRAMFIKEHVNSLKKKLKISSFNPIYKHFL